MERIKEKTGKSDMHFLPLDLSSFESIQKAARELKEKETKLDVLINNAYAPLRHRLLETVLTTFALYFQRRLVTSNRPAHNRGV